MAIPSTHNLIQLFTREEYDDLYGFPNFSDEERVLFYTLSLHDKKFVDSFRKIQDKIYCLLSLGYFRAKQTLIDFNVNLIIADRRYLMETYYPTQKTPRTFPSQAQKISIQNKILVHEKSIRLNKNIKENIDTTLSQLIKRHPKARPLTKALLHHLSKQRIALPAYSTLQRLITKAISQEQDRIYKTCQKVLKLEEQLLVNLLLTQDESLYPITVIKQDVKDFSYSELNNEIKRHDLLKPLFYMAETILKHTEHPKKTIDYYGSLVNFYSVYKLNRMPAPQAHWYLLCYSFRRYQKINDNLIQFFQYYVNNFHDEIDKNSQEKLKQLQHDMRESLIKAGQVLQLFTENDSLNAVEKQRAFKILSEAQMPIVQEFLLGNTRDEVLFYWASVDSSSHKIRLYLRQLFITIDFSLSQKTEVGSFITVMKAFLQKPQDFPKYNARLIKFIPDKLMPYLVDMTNNSIRMSRFEYFFYQVVSSAIKSKKVFLTHSLHYKPLKDELIAESVWEKQKPTILKDLGYSKLVTPIEQLLADYRKKLDPLIVSVNQRITSGENTHVKLKQKSDTIHWSLPYQKKPDAINNPFFLQLPQINIVDVLYFADQQCGFLKAFTPIQSHSTKQERKDPLILATVLANAIRMGTYKMAANANLNLQELMTTEKTYFRLETLRDAIDTINNATAQLRIFPFWNIHDKLHSSFDGSKIGTKLHTLKARYSPKYFGLTKGVSSFNLITNHLPINAHTIGANEHESRFAFPLVFNNTSEINPGQHSGDGHSINQFNFTLFDIINHSFMPHFPQIQKKSIYCFGNPDEYENCIIKPTRKIREKLIISEWPTLQHIFASVLQGETDQSSIIQILSSHEYHTKTKEALWEYDGILKSLYILNYVDNTKIGQAVRAALNRGESYHQLSRAIACINGGRFRGSTELEMEIWNECARLVASAIIFYNSYILSALLDNAKGDKQIEIATQWSPVAWGHLNFLGNYDFHRRQLSLEIHKWLKNIKVDSPEFVL